ncbi:hypothetical protein ACIRPK_07725 [Kitasatospora sp. NPDC101801]|uniref:hypothetical protein n=1 Tax=Kitasatospora sp. NPDC101801 TaxID=3364103 RepID=UPI00380520AF
MRIARKFGAGIGTLLLTASLSTAGAGSANAVQATGCGSSTSPILVSHPVSLMADKVKLGELYLGYFGDCKGVYAEIHWNYGAPSPVAPDAGGQGAQAMFHVEGTLYVEGENKDALLKTNFRLDHPDGSYTTSPIMNIYTNLAGKAYAAPLKFLPDVDLTVYKTDYRWSQSTLCANKHIWGNWHTFSDGGWGSGRYGDCN